MNIVLKWGGTRARCWRFLLGIQYSMQVKCIEENGDWSAASSASCLGKCADVDAEAKHLYMSMVTKIIIIIKDQGIIWLENPLALGSETLEESAELTCNRNTCPSSTAEWTMAEINHLYRLYTSTPPWSHSTHGCVTHTHTHFSSPKFNTRLRLKRI